MKDEKHNSPFCFLNDVNNKVIREILYEDGYLNVIASCEKNKSCRFKNQ